MSSKFKPGIKTGATSLFSIYSTTDFCKRLCPDFRRNTISSPFRSRNDQEVVKMTTISAKIENGNGKVRELMETKTSKQARV